MDQDHDAYFDAELRAASRSLTSHLYHYTSAEAGVFGILNSGTLRLSPFESTNDLWESRPTYLTLSAHEDDVEILRLGEQRAIWEEIDRHIRVNAKVACLTQDWELPQHVMDRDALRGWAHLSLWAHYGAHHAGICLRFDRERLVEALAAPATGDARVFHGPVTYRSVSMGTGPHGIDIGQVREFGVDAVAIAHADTHSSSIFFRKHIDWANESEYRLVRLDQSPLHFDLDIKSALTGVVLGDRFPKHRLPALMEVLSGYPRVELFRASFHNRRLTCWPFDRSQNEAPDVSPHWAGRRSGTLGERISALRMAEVRAADLHDVAESAASELRARMLEDVRQLSEQLRPWPATDMETWDGIDAVPPRERARRPGVLGEEVHYETGSLVVLTAVPDRQHVFVASAALQVIGEDRFRLHAAVRTEIMTDAPNHQREHWRVAREGAISSGAAIWDEVHQQLRAAALGLQGQFDLERRLGSVEPKLSGDQGEETTGAR